MIWLSFTATENFRPGRKLKKVLNFYNLNIVESEVDEIVDKNGNKTTKIIEVKPKKQTIPPKLKSNGTKPTKRYLTEVMTYGINSAKWKAAKDYCSDRKWEFLIFTEKELGLV